jgi:hypothetical protein
MATFVLTTGNGQAGTDLGLASGHCTILLEPLTSPDGYIGPVSINDAGQITGSYYIGTK